MRVGDAVLQDLLAVDDGLGIIQARENHLFRDLEEKGVASRHGPEERVQVEVPDKLLLAAGKLNLRVKVRIPVQEMGLHGTTFFFKSW